MKFLTAAISRLPEFQTLSEAVDKGAYPAAVTGLSGIHKANIIYSLCSLKGRGAFVVAADEAEAQRLCDDLGAMGMRALFYPARDFSFRDTEGVSHEYEHQRLQVLARLLSGECDCVVACMDAALQYTLPPEELERRRLTLKAGQAISEETVMSALLSCGYVRARAATMYRL